MAVNNSLQKKPQTESMATEYESNGEKVKLSPAIIKRYLVSGGGNVTDGEVMMFLSLCRFQHLNPFLREAHLIKYGESQPATMVVGKDVFLKRARREKDFGGMEAGIIVRDNETGEVTERAGMFYDGELEKLVGGWAKVYIKGYSVPVYASVPMDEYIGRKKNGEVTGQWASKPATMIRKVALVQALREAFPDETAGMYAPEEIPEAQNVVLDETPIMQDDVANLPEPEKDKPVQEQPETDVQSALFN